MGLIGGVLDLANSIVSASTATHGGGSSSPKMEVTDGGRGMELDAGPLKVSISDQGVSVQLDGKEIAKVGNPEGESDDKPAAPPLDLHGADTFEPAKKVRSLVAGLFGEKSGIGSKPGGTGEGRR